MISLMTEVPYGLKTFPRYKVIIDIILQVVSRNMDPLLKRNSQLSVFCCCINSHFSPLILYDFYFCLSTWFRVFLLLIFPEFVFLVFSSVSSLLASASHIQTILICSFQCIFFYFFPPLLPILC